MKISYLLLRISDSLKISDFSNSLRVLQHPKHPQQYAYESRFVLFTNVTQHRFVGPTEMPMPAAHLSQFIINRQVSARAAYYEETGGNCLQYNVAICLFIDNHTQKD